MTAVSACNRIRCSNPEQSHVWSPPLSPPRKISYVSGTRADFGLIARTLQLASATPGLDLSVCVTGMHLSPTFGSTVHEIESAGLRICGRIPVDVETASGASMAVAIGHQLVGMATLFQQERPDAVMVLGDRGEMLAGAIAAIHLNIPVVHVHGGERSGTVDEPVRHAISKLAHYHFVATEGARERLVRMGERSDCIFVTGAPGLDGLTELPTRSRDDLCADLGFNPARPVALVIHHPVVQRAAEAGVEAEQLIAAVLGSGVQALCLMPNSDAGSQHIRETLGGYAGHADVRVLVHLGRERFASWLAAADVMVGNSSSGIIEAASFGLPVVNVGNRQHHRERSGNVEDVASGSAAPITAAIARALRNGRTSCANVYGDGRAGERIVAWLASLPLGPDVLLKSNAY